MTVDLKEQIPYDRIVQLIRILTQICTELLAVLSYPLWRIFNPTIFLDENAQHTILIVERWFSTNGLHDLWVKYLTNKGFRVYTVNFPIQHGTFDQSAQELRDYIQKNDLKNFTLVGISGGGLTAYVYLQEYDGWKKVNRFISLGTAFYGTFAALFISFIMSGRELLPNSELTKKIKQQKVQHPEKIFTVAARFDELSPKSSTLLPGAHHITVDVFGHNNFHLDTKKTYDIVAKLASEA